MPMRSHSLDKGLELLALEVDSTERSQTELQYQKRKGIAWMAAKGWGATEVLEAYERAEQLCDKLGDETERFAALRGRAQYYMISGQPRSAQTISLKCAGIARNPKTSAIAIETNSYVLDQIISSWGNVLKPSVTPMRRSRCRRRSASWVDLSLLRS